MKIHILCLILLLTGVKNTFSQMLEYIPSIDGKVITLATQGDTVYAGGAFARVYTPDSTAHFGAVVSRTDAQVLDVSSKPNGFVTCAISDGNKGFFISGKFTKIGDSTRLGIAHLDSVGKVTGKLGGMQTNGDILTLFFRNDTLIIGGEFHNVNGSPRTGIAVLKASTNQVLASSLNTNGSVLTLKASGNTLYVGGGFNTIGGQPRIGVASLNLANLGVNAWTPAVPSSSAAVYSIAITDLAIYIGGYFDFVSRKNLAAFDKQTGALTSFTHNFGMNDRVWAMETYGDTLIVGGDFSNTNMWYVRISQNSMFNASLAIGLPAVRSITIDGDRVYVASNTFSNPTIHYNAFSAHNLRTNEQVKSWDPGATGFISGICVAVSGENVYVGGTCQFLGGKKREGIMAFLASTGRVLDWNPSVNGEVRAIQRVENTIYIGGSFDSVNNVKRRHFASVDANSGALNPLNLNPNKNVNTFALKDNILFVGGRFDSIGGQIRRGITSVDITTGIERPSIYGPLWPGAEINSLAVSDDRLYAGGPFSYVLGSVSRSAACAFDISTAALLPWNPAPYPSLVNTIVPYKDKVFLGGNFTKMNGLSVSTQPFFATVDSSAGKVIQTIGKAMYGFDKMIISNGILYTSSYANSPNHPQQKHVSAFNCETLDLSSWATYPQQMHEVLCVGVSGNKMFFGGWQNVFPQVSPDSPRMALSGIQLDTAISIDSIPAKNYCAGSYLQVSFTDNTVCDTSNIYTVELSDPNGDFSIPTMIGRVRSQYSSMAECHIPIDVPLASGYRIRVISSSPNRVSEDNGYDLAISDQLIVGFSSQSLFSQCFMGHNFAFTDTSSSQSQIYRQWTFGDNSSSTVANPSKTYSAPGIYTIKLVLSNALGCTNFVSTTVKVWGEPSAVLSPAGTVGLCNNDSLLLVSSPGSTYLWQKNNLPLPSSGTQTYKLNTGGSYRVIVSDSNNCVDTSAITTVILKNSPKAIINTTSTSAQCIKGNRFTFHDSSSVASGTLTRLWALDDSTFSFNINTSKAYPAPGEYFVKLVSSANGCKDSASYSIKVFPQPGATISTTGKLSICSMDSLSLNANSGTKFSYAWLKNDTLIPTPSQAVFNVRSSGAYKVIVADTNMCADTSLNVSVNVNDNPQKPTILLKGLDSLVSDISAASYNWYLNDQFIDMADSQYYITVTSGDYTVELVNDSGCTSISDSYTYTYVGMHELLITGDDIILSPNPAIDCLNIVTNRSLGTYTIAIFDLNGKKIAEQKNNTGMIRLSLPLISSGLYLVKIITENIGTISKRVVINQQ
jgi:hypothetical protein